MTRELKGLTREEVEKSRKKHGSNTLNKEKGKGFFRKFLDNLNDPIIKVLIFAVIVELAISFGNCNYLELFGIISAILIATTVSTVSELGSEKAFKRLKEDELDSKVRVLRDGEIVELLPSELVVGDIVYISSGEKVQADGIMLSGKIKVDQSALNGEGREVKKEPARITPNWELSASEKLFRGSIVVEGNAAFEVRRVGADSYFGMIAHDIQKETRVSPLKLRLARLASQISKIGYFMAALVGLTYLFNTLVADNGFIWEKIVASVTDIKNLSSVLLHALTLMITVVVVAAPEGLPMMVTVVLSANMKKMLRDGVLVKKLVGIETAGSLNILFTDKTGTITTGILECDKIISQSESYNSINALKKNKELYELILLSAVYNTECEISSGKIIGGNATDKAIRKYFLNAAYPKAQVSEKIPFNSEIKYSKVVFKDGLTLIKGAPEIIFSKVKYALCEGGELAPFDRIKTEQAFYSNARSGERVIALAYRNGDSGDYVFLSLIILRDKLRQNVKDAIRGVKTAGVQIVMLTGDSRETAAAIARESGILTSYDEMSVLSSEELQNMSDEELKEVIPRLRVVARALPQDKTRLVRISQEMDLVVGMTGDGINDAPSLKLADIGFAMESGADIAKDAGDIVILDNSFLAINRTILYGRTIFKSIRKFITFQLIMNLAACGISLIGQFLGIDSPITIIQMLWINIIMDTLGGLAFSAEPALEYYMKEKPKRRDEPILSREMLNHIAFTGAYTLLLCFLFLRLDSVKQLFRASEGGIYHMTAFYALFIFAGIFNCFGARCERVWILSNIKKNKLFLIIMALISVIQILMIYFGGTAFRSAPLTLSELLCVLLIAFTVVPFEIIRRMLYKIF
ncbi:MAG: calcium-translocating P-type ATPase, PMCA-type [Clostridia bacterium]|nr:calcium-translocating P-type ATPase, PMCA-type [Clostridia bacterium]